MSLFYIGKNRHIHSYKIIPIYGVQIFFFTNTVPVLAHTLNMGENKSLYYMNEILLAEIHCDFMYVKIFDHPVFVFILET